MDVVLQLAEGVFCNDEEWLIAVGFRSVLRGGVRTSAVDVDRDVRDA